MSVTLVSTLPPPHHGDISLTSTVKYDWQQKWRAVHYWPCQGFLSTYSWIIITIATGSEIGNSVHVCVQQGGPDHGLSNPAGREVSLMAVRPHAVPYQSQAAPRVCSSSIPVWCCTYCAGTHECTGTSQSYLTWCCTVWQSCAWSHTVLKQRWVFAVKYLEDCCLELLWLGVLKGRCWWPQLFLPLESKENSC